MPKRGCRGACRRMSARRLPRHVSGFAGRHDIRSRGTPGQMTAVAQGMAGRRLRYADLVA